MRFSSEYPKSCGHFHTTRPSFAIGTYRGSSRFESLISSHHSRFIYECNEEEINDDDDDRGVWCLRVAILVSVFLVQGLACRVWRSGLFGVLGVGCRMTHL